MWVARRKMISPQEVLTLVILLQGLSPCLGWAPIVSPRTLQSYASRQLQVMHPPARALFPVYALYAPDFHFPMPKTQSFYSASLSPFRQPVYEFGYTVNDPKEENYQEKSETRVGDSVKGYYSVREPNGYVRLVRYVSDENGFQTQVSHHHADDHGGAYLFTQARRVT